jgi:hypothetical protein
METTPVDINQKINMRGLVADWLKYQEERFKEDLDKKVYGLRTNRKGVQRSLLGAGYTFGSGKSRTNALRTNWRNSLSGSGEDVSGAQYSFLLYGRFIDMGVGKGASYALGKYQSQKKNGEPRTRKPIRWYSRRKGYELHRLRELMTKYHIDISLETLENALTAQIEVIL